MMGDNRHNSEDSRFWGFVPEDHIVGKPVFIWMSFDKYANSLKDKIRWERVFTTVHFDGPRRSYFWPFVLVVALFYGVSYLRKRKASKNASKPTA
jgi:signal peptidase I